MSRLKFVVLSVILILLPVAAQAQDTTTVVGFTTGGQTQILRYVQSRQPIVSVIEDAVTSAIRRYDRLFGVSAPPVVIDVLSTPSSTGEEASTSHEHNFLVPAPTGSLDSPQHRDVCFVVVNKNSATEPPTGELQFIIAHEIAHCYQFYHLPESSSADDATSLWWTEGSAEWMASLVYTPTDAGNYWIDHQTAYMRHLGHPLWDFSYDSFFFWEFLASRLGGNAGVMRFLRSIPTDPGQYETYLARQFSDLDTLFHDYGLAVARRSLNDLPDDSTLWSQNEQTVSSLPNNVNLQSGRLSFNLYHVHVSGLAPGMGVILTASDLTASDTRVALSDGTEIPELTPITVCQNPDDLHLVISRGATSADSSAVLNLQSTPCPTPTPAAINANNCLVGQWALTGWPTISGLDTSFDGLLQLTVNADGTTALSYQDFALTTHSGDTTIKVVLNGTLTNTIHLNSQGVVTGSSAVGGFDDFHADTSVNGAPGPSIPLANYFQSMGGAGIPEGARVVCQGNQLQVFVNAHSIDGPFVYTRQ